MIIVDSALQRLQQEGRPIRVAMVGAGFMGRGIALQFLTAATGMRLVAISNRSLEGARRAYSEAGAPDPRVIENLAQLEDAVARGQYAVTEDALLLCRAGNIDAVIEVTGTVEFAARVTEAAIENGKHVILMNAELDGTLGPVLKAHADKAGVILTNADGDQPGAIMNLYRFVRGIGVKPVLCGNIKGLQDRYRTPATQAAFARKWGQKARMVTSFADGTKISFEQAVVANATGMRVAQRGMIGPVLPPGTPLVEAIRQYPVEMLNGEPGIVDYLVGADPAPGVFVLGTHDHPSQRDFLNLFKLGDGPVYCFSTPHHLCHFELPNSVGRAVLFHDAAIAPLGPPCVDVVATAKTDLQAGEILDGMGGFAAYGQCENSEAVRTEGLLPMGLAEGCRLKHDIGKDQVIRFIDVSLPCDLSSHHLWNEQNALFGL
jgi:predicted homoserine dehydrogenase-like protein